MAGGTGTRFWPRSRSHRPKQVLPIGDCPVMLEQTLNRLRTCYDSDRIYVITARQHRERVVDVCPSLPVEQIIGEPEGRDTAPCAGLGGLIVSEWHDPETIIGVFPADHRIDPEEDFCETVDIASQVCSQWGGITTLGIEPDFPSTGYGYIEYNSNASRSLNNQEVFPVRRFTEKPDEETARKFLEEDRYLWNSGMFFWKASHILEEINKYMPSLARGLKKIREELKKHGDLDRAMESHYGDLPATSVDYGILEQSEMIWTVPARFEWNDLGTWDALESIIAEDDQGNVVSGDVVSLDTETSILVSSEDGPMIGTCGLENCIVVTTEDAVLVCRKDRTEDVKKLVQLLEEQGRDELL